MIVKKTWRNRLTAFISTAKRYNHASPDILADYSSLESWFRSPRISLFGPIGERRAENGAEIRDQRAESGKLVGLGR